MDRELPAPPWNSGHSRNIRSSPRVAYALVMETGDLLLALIVAVSSALGATGGTIFTERRRERRQRDQEKDQRDRDLKEAARLVDEELRDATDLLRTAIYGSRWWPGPRQLSSDVYTRYRHILALYLDDSPSADVSHAYQELNRVNWVSEPGRPLASPPRPNRPPGRGHRRRRSA